MSEGRRDQCEAPSDPKFPDCSGKVEVRPGAEDGGRSDPGAASSLGTLPQTSSEVLLLAGMSLLVRTPLPGPRPLTLVPAGRGQPQGGDRLSAWAVRLAHQPKLPRMVMFQGFQ